MLFYRQNIIIYDYESVQYIIAAWESDSVNFANKKLLYGPNREIAYSI